MQYNNDEGFQKIFTLPSEPYKRVGKRLYLEHRLCIPKGSTRKTLLHDLHESLLGAHRGFKKTLRKLKEHFFWPRMNKEVQEYITTYNKCQAAKSSTQKQAGNLRPFPPPSKKWEEISMDFIFELPKTKQTKTAILVVVEKLSKRTHFISLYSNQTAKDTAEEIFREIYKHHGLPRKIISDRDSRFTTLFWTELMKLLKVKLNLSTTFHPQTDGQSERAFRTLEEMLRCFVSYTQNDWDTQLPGLEFAYNNHVNDTTEQTPFFLEYGQNPFSIADIIHSDVSETPIVSTNTFVNELQEANRLAQEAISATNVIDADIINQHRREQYFETGDLVMLSTNNLPLQKGISKKLSPKYVGPFTILDKLAAGNDYKLDLQDQYKYIHHTFHTSLLKPYNQDTTERESADHIPFALSQEEKNQVERILSHRLRDNDIQFLVHFKDTSPTENSWINKHELDHHQMLIEHYFNTLFEDE